MFYTSPCPDISSTKETIKFNTALWFSKNKNKNIPELFYHYFEECQAGELGGYYSMVFDSSTECLTETLPEIARNISPEIANIISAPDVRVRIVISFLLYWLIQYHANQSTTLPHKNEIINFVSEQIKNH